MRSRRSMIPGAASHISLMGGWLPRKSPPYTVSSKCFQVESPSPFKFLAALMPPCAHTECERFTGTIENRSTCPPISAILMTALNPATPPPHLGNLNARPQPSQSATHDNDPRSHHLNAPPFGLESHAASQRCQ